jgi:hypothetical protein
VAPSLHRCSPLRRNGLQGGGGAAIPGDVRLWPRRPASARALVAQEDHARQRVRHARVHGEEAPR